MRSMGLEALGRSPARPSTPAHRIYPYLLRDLTVDRPNQVWAADITYIPIGRGFLYLVASSLGEPGGARLFAVQHEGRKVLHGRAERGAGPIRPAGNFQLDEGSQFTSADFTGALDRQTRDLDGWPRSLDGQHVHPAPLAVAEI